ncbi:MAG TPA: SRPBCC family protein [Chitinophagaceae bacterium]|nr:SRPBCC family protein [Chitinophagaceae bacterium]
MKFIKPLFVFLVFVIIATAILSLLMPTKQKLERSITINAPSAVVYEQLSRLENFNKWSVWTQQDTSATYTLSGNDGTVGATSSWTGEPGLSGEGKMQITGLIPGQKVTHSFEFRKPKRIDATSFFTLNEGSGSTIVTWNFEMATPRPWNIFNLFYSMDKEMGKDFEKGLASLKEVSEKTSGTAVVAPASFEVMQIDFPATTFAYIRQIVKWKDIQAFFAQHLPLLYEDAAKNNSFNGIVTGLYSEWDEKNQQADLAAAIPVPAGTKTNSNIIRITDIGASKALQVTYQGAYDRMGSAHGSIDKYIVEKKLKAKLPVIEQYIYGPANEKDTGKWQTKIIYLVE